MELTWLGTAGFKIKTTTGCLVIDPYLSRNNRARPRLDIPDSVAAEAGAILISHGHFDHLADVPRLAGQYKLPVFCDPIAAATLTREGLDPALITQVEEDGQAFNPAGFQAEAHYSRHVDFDARLIISTLLKVNFRLPKYKPLLKNWPHGQVLSWRIQVEGRTLHHFGSAGSPPEELDHLARLDRPDILLVPLQGHSKICDIALNYVTKLKPRLVIPPHQDDFYPPISQMVNIQPFIQGVAKMPDVELITLEPGEPREV